MCLYKITKRFQPPKRETITAYKIFYFDNSKNGLEFQHYGGRVKTGVWLTASAIIGEIPVEPTHVPWYTLPWNRTYQSGFHCFISPDDAHQLVIHNRISKVVRVQVSDVHTIGLQFGNIPILVARYMFVPHLNPTEE